MLLCVICISLLRLAPTVGEVKEIVVRLLGFLVEGAFLNTKNVMLLGCHQGHLFHVNVSHDAV